MRVERGHREGRGSHCKGGAAGRGEAHTVREGQGHREGRG